MDEDEISIDLDSCKKIRNYVNTKICSDNLNKGTLTDVIENLEEYKKYIENSINNIILSIEKSHDNFFILNNEIIEKIYQKKPKSITLKLKEIIESKSSLNEEEIDLHHAGELCEPDFPRLVETEPCDNEEWCCEDDEEEKKVDECFPDDILEWVDLKN